MLFHIEFETREQAIEMKEKINAIYGEDTASVRKSHGVERYRLSFMLKLPQITSQINQLLFEQIGIEREGIEKLRYKHNDYSFWR